jgi:hypothetical protein
VEPQSTIEELDTMAQLHDVKAHGLERGHVGAVVYQYPSGDASTVEFVTGDRETVAVLPLSGDEIRFLGQRGLLHACALAK